MITVVQRKLLYKIAHYTDRGVVFNKHREGGNHRSYDTLRNLGYIHSHPPFAGMYHFVTITDAGRKLLKDTEK